MACDCDPTFHREILPAGSSLHVAACLRCGTVTCSRSYGDDGRFTGDSWQEVRTVRLTDAVHGWIAGWPRIRVDDRSGPRWPMSADFVRCPTLHYPAEIHCADLDQVAEWEARLTREQSERSPAERLRATHRVHSAPPSGLPPELEGYRLLWEALHLRPDIP